MTEFEFDFDESIFSEITNSESIRLTKLEKKANKNAHNEPKKRTSQRKNRSNITVRSMDADDRKAYHAAMKVTRGQRKDNAMRSLTADIHVCIDLDFSEDNSDREKRSLMIQIRNSYGAIRQSETPVALHLASLVDDVIIDGIAKQNADQWHIHRHEESVLDVFPLQDIVYMSPDAEHALEAVVPGKVYVIGGIVDRNIKRKITLEKATCYEVSSLSRYHNVL
jgi:tRNA (guanine9-N1)-methyltransferase